MIKTIGPNQTVLFVHGWEILFSYNTPVAAFNAHSGYFKTEKKHSRTTSKHISNWTPCKAEERPQEFFDKLVKV